jgi:hypothetical protein
MKRLAASFALVVCLAWGAAIRGVVTDPSGASVPGAAVVLRGGSGERRATTGLDGSYSFSSVPAGTYSLSVAARGFDAFHKKNIRIAAQVVLDLRLAIRTEKDVVNVESESNAVGADAASNATTIVLHQKELAALSDDLDELSQELQAMAGPGAGPNGGQIYIDGFTGGNLPPKSSIREVRINSNPFAAEYDRPGFGRIEIFTKPGTDALHGQAFFQYNKETLNSRSPLLAQATRPPYKQEFFGVNLTGPIRRQKASFSFDAERRAIDENAFVYATTLDDNLQPRLVNEAVVTPQTRTSFSPRLDYSLTPANTLTARTQSTRVEMDNEGVGGYGLASRAYRQTNSEDAVQLSETAVLNPSAVNETRFQFLRSDVSNLGSTSAPAIHVEGAFDGGGSQVGDSGSVSRRWELTNITTVTRRRHTLKWGARLRQSFIDDTSRNNFGGTFTFLGGTGPELDALNRAVPGTSIQLTALERYRRTLLFQAMGLSADEIRALGGGASQFTLNAGIPGASVSQLDAGLFLNDDWRVRPNLSLGFGLRYETQTNIHDWGDWSPRIGVAWGIDGHGNKAAKTVLRAGFGVFYDRVSESDTLQARRYNGIGQQSYFIQSPDFFPNIPSPGSLAAGRQPQQLKLLDPHAAAPRTYQASAGVDRQVSRSFRIGVQYVNMRGVHLERSVNINAPIGGVYPYGDRQIRLVSETTGLSRANMLVVSPNLSYRKVFLFGFYASSWGKDDNEGMPADPYNLRGEWGPSSFADVRQRVVVGSSLPVFWKLSISPFLMASSGTPYNITTGLDTNGDGFASERPALAPGLSASSCTGSGLVYAAGFGCFNLTPAAGTPTIGRNSARGPGSVTLNLRLARTWGFGSRRESGTPDFGPPPGMGGVRGGEPPPGPPPGGGPGGGPPPGAFGSGSGQRYNLTLSLMARNVLNHPNYGTPDGNLSSPFFGQYRSLAGFGPFGGNTTYNRKIDVQLRFAF